MKTERRVSQKQAAFLAAYSALGLIGRAARAAGCSRYSHRRWLETDPDYPAKFAEAKEEAIENIEAEARRRAVSGTAKLKFYKGQPIIDPRTGQPYVEHEYSDRLLELALKAHMPQKYTDRAEIKTSDSIPIEYDPDELELMRAMAKGVLEARQRKANDPG